MTTIHAYCQSMFVGMSARVEIEITAAKETRTDYIDARVTGHQGWKVGSGKSEITHRIREPYVVKRLSRKQVLPVGVTRFGFEVTLPPGTPPSHTIAPGYAYVELRVHVSIPWRLDDRFKFRLPVRLAPGPPVAPSPAVWRSHSLRGDEPRIELGVATSRVAAADSLVGSFAVYHMDDRKPREVTIELVPIEELYGRGRPRIHRGTGIGTRVTVPAGTNATSIPFEIPLPPTLAPSFVSLTHQLGWQLVATTGGMFSGGKVSVGAPLQIVDALAADPTSRHAIPPGLTDDRVAGVFANFARARGWHAVDDAHAAGLTIARAEGESQLQLAYTHRGEAGTFLRARVAHPSLGLGLEVTPSSVLRHVFFKDIEVGVPAWDRAHLVHARDEAQALPVLREAVPALADAETIGTLVRWTDHAIELERLVVAVIAEDLEQAGMALARVATAVASASQQATPPAGCVVDVEAWQALERMLDGHLALADLSIAGTRGAVPVHLGLDFDDHARPSAVHATVGDPEQAGELARGVSLVLAHPAAEAALAASSGAPGAVTDLVARWPEAFGELHLANGVVAASYRLPAGEPRVIDAQPVRELVESLHAVLAALAPENGPYR